MGQAVSVVKTISRMPSTLINDLLKEIHTTASDTSVPMTARRTAIVQPPELPTDEFLQPLVMET
jgi:hypothetical protein